MTASVHLALPFEQYIQELAGNPTKFREKLISIISVYSKPLTMMDYRKHLHSLTGEVAVYEDFVTIANVDSTVFYPKTLGELISLCSSLGVELHWDADIFKKYIYYNSKY